MIARYGPERLKFLHKIMSEKWNNDLKIDPKDLKRGKHDPKDQGEWMRDMDSISNGFLTEIIRRIDKVLRRFDDVIAYA